MKKIILITVILIFSACIHIREKNEYRVRGTTNNYEIKSYPNYDRIFSEKTGVFITVIFKEYSDKKKYKIFITLASIKNPNLKIIDKINISNIEKENIEIKEAKVEKKEIDGINKTLITLVLSENLPKKFYINIGRLEIENDIIQSPSIIMQQYKTRESVGILRDLFYEAGHRGEPFYKKTEWIE